MNANYEAGGYIEAWCTKCKLELGHTIVAMVGSIPKKVKCNTCEGLHNYRSKPSETKRTKLKDSSRKVRAKGPIYEEYISRLTGGDLSRARKYSFTENYQKDEILNHPKFGVGIVLSVIQAHKMEILFKDGTKLLSQNQ